ncbi:MAG: pyruvate kinase [Spirochaetaceae bacterium]
MPTDRVSYRYDIVATLGPVTASPDAWRALVEAGATRFRLNTSHLDVEELGGWLERLAGFSRRTGAEVPVMLDLQGSKWRLGRVAEQRLVPGDVVALELGDGAGTAAGPRRHGAILPVPHRDFFAAAARSDGRVLVNDARVHLEIEDLDEAAGRATARVATGGPVAAAKGITLAETGFRRESLSEKDRRILALARRFAGVEVAISYVKDGTETAAYRAEVGGEVRLTAKLERPSALADIDGIASVAEELWLCRGDLGAEVGPADMARAVHAVTKRVAGLQLPCLMAGQVLEHMTREPQPTRAEVVQLYELLAAGFAGVVLSDETAVGGYPIEATKTAALFAGRGT